MVHKSSIIPGLSQFLDTSVLSHYPPTSMKRIIAAGAIALYLQQNANIVDTLLNNELIKSLGVTTPDGMVNIDVLRNVYRNEISKAGFMRITFPILDNVDFTVDDVDTLYNIIMTIDNNQSAAPAQLPCAVNGVG
jgi:hypothetical protein